MQISKKTEPQPRVLNILLFDGFSNLCLANFLEPFRAANTLARDPVYTWRCLTMDGQTVRSSSALSLTPDDALTDQDGDILAVMPSYGFRGLVSGALQTKLRASSKRHLSVAGLDTGSWLLAHAGLLDGVRATIHWEELSQFEEAFPDVDVVRERYVVDGSRITCSGALAAFDLAQFLIAEDHGPVLALEVGEFLMSDRRTGAVPPTKSAGSALVNRAWKVMQANLESPLDIKALARTLGCSQKTLELRMRADLGTTPDALYRRLRMTQARKLVLETGQSVAEIAGRCGYENPSAMTRAFRKEFGQTPRELRLQIS